MMKETVWNPGLYNDKHAFVYDYGKDLIQLLAPQKNERILDLGCGSGQLTNEIRLNALEVIGIDKSKSMIADAKSKYDDIVFEVKDAANFKYDKPFDAIFSNAALHWVKNYKAAIQNMYDCLKQDGRIVLEFGGKGNVQIIVNQLRKSLLKRGYDTQSNLQLWYFPSIAEYTTALENEGFKVDMAQHYDRPTELADEITGIKDWITMFGEAFFNNVTIQHIEEIKEEVQELVKSNCFIEGKWYADYKRIRVVARKL